MNQQIIHASLVVKDYDEAIEFYVGKLKFQLVEDTLLENNKRWVVVAPTGDGVMSLLLARAATDDQLKRVGDQAGGRVFLFLATDDFERDYQQMLNAGVVFVREPAVQPYGKVAVFSDPYGNLWDLLEPSESHRLYSDIRKV